MLTPLFRFHLRVGVRLALRAGAPLVGLPVVALLLQQDPAGALRGLAAWLFAPPGNLGTGLAVAVIALALAGWATPRVTAGMAGWLRHLPVTEAGHRRAALAALVTAQAPLFVASLLLAPLAAHQAGGVAPGRSAALLVTMGAAALAAWPGTHPWRSRPLALLAICFAAPAQIAGILIAVALVVASERLAGPFAPTTRAPRRRLSPSIPTPMLVGVRALGSTLFVAPVLALIPLAAMAVLRINNDLPPGIAAGAARLGGGVGVAVLIAAMVERLAVRRPAWCWARSLPAAAAQRIGEDAILLGAPCLVPLAITGWLDPIAALAVAMCVPALAVRGAGALRRSMESRTGPATRLLAEAMLLACWVALVPWLALAALAALPLAWRAAAAEDRRQKVSRWEERHHRTTGDPLSWSAR